MDQLKNIITCRFVFAFQYHCKVSDPVNIFLECFMQTSEWKCSNINVWRKNPCRFEIEIEKNRWIWKKLAQVLAGQSEKCISIFEMRVVIFSFQIHVYTEMRTRIYFFQSQVQDENWECCLVCFLTDILTKMLLISGIFSRQHFVQVRLVYHGFKHNSNTWQLW